jgi:hypothetical protein
MSKQYRCELISGPEVLVGRNGVLTPCGFEDKELCFEFSMPVKPQETDETHGECTFLLDDGITTLQAMILGPIWESNAGSFCLLVRPDHITTPAAGVMPVCVLTIGDTLFSAELVSPDVDRGHLAFVLPGKQAKHHLVGQECSIKHLPGDVSFVGRVMEATKLTSRVGTMLVVQITLPSADEAPRVEENVGAPARTEGQVEAAGPIESEPTIPTLDVLVAQRIFGLRVQHLEDGRTLASDLEDPRARTLEELTLQPYSTDMGCAWRVAEALIESGLIVSLRCGKAGDELLVACDLRREVICDVSCSGNTPAEAICQAALLAVECGIYTPGQRNDV